MYAGEIALRELLGIKTPGVILHLRVRKEAPKYTSSRPKV